MDLNHIRILARIRPLSIVEMNDLEDKNIKETTLEVLNQSQLVLTPLTARNKRYKKSSFQFDAIFEECTTQAQVFEHVQGQVHKVLHGENATILTYGQTGTGKTHTMLGHDVWNAVSVGDVKNAYEGIREQEALLTEQCGLVPRAVHELLRNLEKELQVVCSYVEIYNDRIYDLVPYDGMSEQEHRSVELEIRESPNGHRWIQGVATYAIRSMEHVTQLLWNGAKNRATRATDMNQQSSRSHSILQVMVCNESKGTKSKLMLVDLAGSEKYQHHSYQKQTSEHMKELARINQSLSCLSNCISALQEKPKREHIPYRDSKLTRLLQDSLNGNSYTSIILTLSGHPDAYNETFSTLQFANRAMNIVIPTPIKAEAATINEKYAFMIQELQFEVEKLQDVLTTKDERIAELEQKQSTRVEALTIQLSKERKKTSKLLIAVASMLEQHEQDASSLGDQDYFNNLVSNLEETNNDTNIENAAEFTDKNVNKQNVPKIDCVTYSLKGSNNTIDVVDTKDNKRTDQMESPEKPLVHEQSAWKEFIDNSTGYKYFHNTVTGATQWDCPFTTIRS